MSFGFIFTAFFSFSGAEYLIVWIGPREWRDNNPTRTPIITQMLGPRDVKDEEIMTMSFWTLFINILSLILFYHLEKCAVMNIEGAMLNYFTLIILLNNLSINLKSFVL